jgi:hypothetical protein
MSNGGGRRGVRGKYEAELRDGSPQSKETREDAQNHHRSHFYIQASTRRDPQDPRERLFVIQEGAATGCEQL